MGQGHPGWQAGELCRRQERGKRFPGLFQTPPSPNGSLRETLFLAFLIASRRQLVGGCASLEDVFANKSGTSMSPAGAATIQGFTFAAMLLLIRAPSRQIARVVELVDTHV